MTKLNNINNLKHAREQFEILYINDALRNNNESIRSAAETLGLHYSSLFRKMRGLGMSTNKRRYKS